MNVMVGKSKFLRKIVSVILCNITVSAAQPKRALSFHEPSCFRQPKIWRNGEEARKIADSIRPNVSETSWKLTMLEGTCPNL